MTVFPRLTRSRFLGVYAGLFAIWATTILGLLILLTRFIGPDIEHRQAEDLQGLVRSHAANLELNKDRMVREEMLERKILQDDRDFRLLRPSDSKDRDEISKSLAGCRFVASQVCVGANGDALVFSSTLEPVMERSSYVLALSHASLSPSSDVWTWFGIGCGLLSFIFGCIGWSIRRQEQFFILKLSRLGNMLNRVSRHFETSEAKASDDEFDAVSQTLEQLDQGLEIKTQQIERLKSKLAEEAKLVAIAQTSQQIAHDIRSQLAALEMVTKLATSLPEEHRLLIRGSTARIKDIANNLLQRHSDTPKSHGEPDASMGSTGARRSINLVSSLVESIVSEKRLEHRAKMGVDIEAILGEDSYGLFALCDPIEFKRILSNLINNAVEVLGDSGKVTIQVGEHDGQACISIADNGRGIPPEILKQLGQRGLSVGKVGSESGSGLGLYHARTIVEAWGGRFEISSEVGHGTTVRLFLRRADAPTWFVPCLKARNNQTVIILDDDANIHRVWEERFSAFKAERGIATKLQSFSTPDAFREFAIHQIENQSRGLASGAATPTLWLVDFELLGFNKTGLDLIQELGLQQEAVLVTSRFEDPSVRERCERLGVRLLPKGLAAMVPLQIG